MCSCRDRITVARPSGAAYYRRSRAPMSACNHVGRAVSPAMHSRACRATPSFPRSATARPLLSPKTGRARASAAHHERVIRRPTRAYSQLWALPSRQLGIWSRSHLAASASRSRRGSRARPAAARSKRGRAPVSFADVGAACEPPAARHKTRSERPERAGRAGAPRDGRVVRADRLRRSDCWRVSSSGEAFEPDTERS